MSIVYLRGDVLMNVHSRLIETYGGVHGVRDGNALESAVARPRNLAEYTGEVRVGAIGASLSWGILRNHPFVDGNKRVALAVLVMFAERNGHRLTCSESEETAMVLRAASSDISEEAWMDWVVGVVEPQSG